MAVLIAGMDDATRKARGTGLGGTDIAALFNRDAPGRKAVDVWREKREGLQTFAGNERTEVGQLLEPIIAGWYAEETGYVVKECRTARHPVMTWALSSPDRLVYVPERYETLTSAGVATVHPTLLDAISGEPLEAWQPDEGLEIKTHGMYGSTDYGDEGTDEVPDRIRLQVAWYQAIWAVATWQLRALIDTHLRRGWVIERDLELEAYLLEEAERFWKVHVIGGRPPDPDGSDSFERYLADRFSTHTAEIVPVADADAWMVSEWVRLRAQEKQLKGDIERLKQQIQSVIGGDAGIIGQEARITWKVTKSGGINEIGLRDHLMDELGLTASEREAVINRFKKPGYRRMHTKLLGGK